MFRTLVGGVPGLYGATFSPNGGLLAISRSDGCIRLYSTTSWDEVRRLKTCQGSPKGIAFSPDGRTLALGAYKEIHLFDTTTWTRTRVLTGHEADVYALAWSPDGRRLASSGGDHTARTWDPATGKEELTLREHSEYVLGLAWTPEGRHLVTGSRDGWIVFWNGRTGRVVRRISGPSFDRIAIRSDGRRMVATAGAKVLEWNLDFDAPDRVLEDGTELSESAYAPDGRHLIWTAGKVMKILDENGKVVARLEGHVDTYIHGIAVAPKGPWIVTVGHDRRICVWGPR